MQHAALRLLRLPSFIWQTVVTGESNKSNKQINDFVTLTAALLSGTGAATITTALLPSTVVATMTSALLPSTDAVIEIKDPN